MIKTTTLKMKKLMKLVMYEFNFIIQDLTEVKIAKTEEDEIQNEVTSQLDMLKFILKIDNEIITG